MFARIVNKICKMVLSFTVLILILLSFLTANPFYVNVLEEGEKADQAMDAFWQSLDDNTIWDK